MSWWRKVPTGSEGSVRRRPLIIGALAFVAVIASHNLAYWLAAPDPHYRAELLHSTGHRYFVYVSAIALGLLVATLTSFLRTGAHQRGSMLARFSYIAPRLLAAQVSGFLALEAGERAFLGSGVGDLLTEKPVLIGLVLQLLVALVGAASVCLVAAVAGRLRRSRQSPRRAAPRTFALPLEPLPLHALVAAGAATPRGPPPA